MPPRAIIGCCVALALGAAGCGGGRAPAAPPPRDDPPPAHVLHFAGLQPVVRARPAGGLLRVRVPIAGEAAPGARVLVSADCVDRRCRRHVTAGGGGRWAVRFTLQARPRRPYVRVTARTPDRSAVALVRLDGPRPRAARAGAPAPNAAPSEAAPAAPAGPPTMAVIGDSLAVGMDPFLPGLLGGWRLWTDARTGRTLAEGMARLDAVPEPPTVLALSLFTNDRPEDVTALQAAVRRTADLQRGHGCAIWATIARPPVDGVSYMAANDALWLQAALQPGVVLVAPWAEEVARHPEWLRGDGVHATQAGYRARAELYAATALQCAG